MALSIKNDEADRLARELAAATGESITEATLVALRERLASVKNRRGGDAAFRLQRLVEDVQNLVVFDPRPADEILGYDNRGLPG